MRDITAQMHTKIWHVSLTSTAGIYKNLHFLMLLRMKKTRGLSAYEKVFTGVLLDKSFIFIIFFLLSSTMTRFL